MMTPHSAPHNKTHDFLIVGAGIVGLSIAWELLNINPQYSIAIIDKEASPAFHASGRNSGILHAGFYYTADSLKARLTAQGNRLMKTFCASHGIPVVETQKVVVARNAAEATAIDLLAERGTQNNVRTEVISEAQLKELDPNVRTHQKALYSPDTASVNPRHVCQTLFELLTKRGVHFAFQTPYEACDLHYRYLINSAGLYADEIAHRFHVGKNYTMLPFKGLYLKYTGDNPPVRINVYPVPNLKHPFLGIHFTITSDLAVKIGPTAIPALWREHYQGLQGFSASELTAIISRQARLFISDSFHFRSLALHEIQNYYRPIFIQRARSLVYHLDNQFEAMPAGIRAQLLHIPTQKLETDFVIEHHENSSHILNAVSPVFTCAFSFASYTAAQVAERYQAC